MPTADRVLVPGGEGVASAARDIPTAFLAGGSATILEDSAPRYAFTTTLEHLAAIHDVVIAQQAARQLEVRLPLALVGPRWPVHALAVAALAAIAGAFALSTAVGLARRLSRR
jgi:hypothetical protein